MKIILDKNWFIEDDGNGYTLTKIELNKPIKKDGVIVRYEDVVIFQNYPPTLEGCITNYVRRKTVDLNTEMTLKGYVNEICEKYGEVLKAIKGENK